MPPVPPSGDPDRCHTLLIGEAPARNEDRKRKPFVGASGTELDYLYLPLAGLTRREVAVCNAQCCSLPHYRNPKPAEAKQCADNHLPRILDHYQPERIILAGSVACSLATTTYPLKPDMEHGIPHVGHLYGWTGPVYPMFHPAAGMRDGRVMSQLLIDFHNLRRYLREGLTENPAQLSYRRAKAAGLDYGVCSTAEELRGYLEPGDRWTAAIDTETISQGAEPNGRTDPPFMLSVSNRPNSGRVVMADAKDALGYLDYLVRERALQVILHNSLFDMQVLPRMGVRVRWERVRDTMVDAYHAGWVAKGLKALAWRHLGIRMVEYDELVEPYATKVQLAYLLQVAIDQDIPQPYLKPRQWKAYRKAQLAVDSALEGKTTPQKRWKEWPDEDKWAIEAVKGRFPYSNITQAPLELSQHYACQDADATFQLVPVMNEEQSMLRAVVRRGAV